MNMEKSAASDTPERLASDLSDFLDSLYEAGTIPSPDPSLTGESAQKEFLNCIQHGEFAALRYILADVEEQSDAPDVTVLKKRLEHLSDAWDASLIYKAEPFIPDIDFDRAYIQAYRQENGTLIKQEVFFLGTTAHCEELVKKLKEGTITAQEVRQMESDDWPEFIPKTQKRDTILDKYPMPDDTKSMKDMEDRGYTDGDLLPVSQEIAAALIEQDMTVYAVAVANTALVFDREEVEAYPIGALFSIPREEWEASQNFRDAVAGRMDHQEEREAAFLNHTGDCFAIYQLRDGNETRDLRYNPLPGQGVDKNYYELAYTGSPTEQDVGYDVYTTCYCNF